MADSPPAAVRMHEPRGPERLGVLGRGRCAGPCQRGQFASAARLASARKVAALVWPRSPARWPGPSAPDLSAPSPDGADVAGYMRALRLRQVIAGERDHRDRPAVGRSTVTARRFGQV